MLAHLIQPARVAALALGLLACGAADAQQPSATALATAIGRNRRSWLLVAGCAVLCVLPLALWVDYLRSIYRADALADPGQVTTPLSGLLWKFKLIRSEFVRTPFALTTSASALAVVAFLAQGVLVIRELIQSGGRSAWALAGPAARIDRAARSIQRYGITTCPFGASVISRESVEKVTRVSPARHAHSPRSTVRSGSR